MGRYKVDYEAGDLIPLEEVMVGATNSIAGIGGIVPPPAPHYQYRLLGGDGTWQKGNFIGTRKEWNSLTKEEKLQFKTADIYKKNCTITYKANNGIDNDIVITVLEGKYTTKQNPFIAPADMLLEYWNTEPDGSGINYKPDKEIYIDDDLTLWAIWDLAALKFSSDEPFTLSVASPGWISGGGTIEYSLDDGSTWVVWDGSELSRSANQNIYLRGSDNTIITGNSTSYKWTFTGKYCTGNIETLLDYQIVASGQHPSMGDYCYYYMFNSCTSLIVAPELPATILTESCYSLMFAICSHLTTAPQLPATALTEKCYYGMFQSCVFLTTAPQLPATTLTDYCYRSMFYNCSLLTTAPELPAKALADYCYYGMFEGCRSLITAPQLPATTLATQCYKSMFKGCTSIKLSTTQTPEYQYAYKIPTNNTGTTATDALTDMFTNTGGTFTGTPTINTTYYIDHQPV